MKGTGSRFIWALLQFSLLAVGVSAWVDFELGALARRALERRTTTPAPVVAGPSQFWDGIDGPWSSFEIQVGNHPQQVRVFPATSLPFINVIPNDGCVTGGPPDCADLRGGLFDSNTSLTWVANSVWNLGIEDNLDLDTTAKFGFDTVQLGWENSGGPTVSHAIISEGAAYVYMLGLLGLDPLPSNFTTYSDPQPSFLQQLKNNNQIPVLGYGYTAGAQYRNNHATFGSLVFGGYDASRFNTSSQLTFPMSQDVQRDLVVAIQSISSGSTQILSQGQGIYAFIDTAVSQLYLPLGVCQQFEQVFGLQWNSSLVAYTINSTQHQANVQNNPSVTFTLGSTTTSSDSISISFPYAAFEKNLSFPFVPSGGVMYFPLNQSQSDTDITLGRAFLQESYLISDYENHMLTIAPCVWPSSFQEQIEVIGQKGSSGLSKGALVGIVVGAVVLIAILLLALWLLHRRKNTIKRRKAAELDAKDTARLQEGDEYKDGSGFASPRGRPMAGSHQLLDSGELHEMAGQNKGAYSELSGHPATWKTPVDRSASEVEGSPAPVYEMPGSEAYSELATPEGTETWNTSTSGGRVSRGRPSARPSPSPPQVSSDGISSGGARFSWQRGASSRATSKMSGGKR